MTDEKPIASEPSPDAGLITSKDVDFSAFESTRRSERLGETKEPEKEPESKPEKVVAEPAPAKKDEAQVSEPADKSKPVPSLTREDIQREIDARLAAQPKKEEPKTLGKRPSLGDEQFPGVPEWEAALEKWEEERTEQRIAAALAKQAEETAAKSKAETEKATLLKSWEEREKETRGRIKDYDELKAKGLPAENKDFLYFLLESKLGPDLGAHYVRNEAEYRDLIAMPPEDMRLELRIVEREIKRGIATAAATPVPRGKTISDAPPPARIIGGTSSAADDPKEKAAIEGDVESYHRQRNAERERDRAGRFK